MRLEATPTNSEFVGLASHELFVRSHGHPKRGIFGSLTLVTAMNKWDDPGEEVQVTKDLYEVSAAHVCCGRVLLSRAARGRARRRARGGMIRQ